MTWSKDLSQSEILKLTNSRTISQLDNHRNSVKKKMTLKNWDRLQDPNTIEEDGTTKTCLCGQYSQNNIKGSWYWQVIVSVEYNCGEDNVPSKLSKENGWHSYFSKSSKLNHRMKSFSWRFTMRYMRDCLIYSIDRIKRLNHIKCEMSLANEKVSTHSSFS